MSFFCLVAFVSVNYEAVVEKKPPTLLQNPLIGVCCLGKIDRQFKLRMAQEKKRDDSRWRLLVRKVLSAKTISSLSLPKRKREEEQRERVNSQGSRSFRL